MITQRQSQSSSSKRVVIPVTANDRQRLHEIKEKLGSWTAVSEALGFRGASTARKWALSDSTTFKGRDYPERIKTLHEKIVGKPIVEKGASNTTNGVVVRRLENVESSVSEVKSMMEMLMKSLGVASDSGELALPGRAKKSTEKNAPEGDSAK